MRIDRDSSSKVIAGMAETKRKRLTALDFFSGSGLVSEGLWPYFKTIWANDNCPKKNAVYAANFGDSYLVKKSIEEVKGWEVPSADLAWASFPCEDLSLAGNMQGLSKGRRSALFWQWIRVLDEMEETARPPVLCVENVVGFLVANKGGQFRLAYEALRKRGYLAGALVLNAVGFVPQSRPRAFLVAVKKGWPLSGSNLTAESPDLKLLHRAVQTGWEAVKDENWLWWKLPPPPGRMQRLLDLIERDSPVNPPELTRKLVRMLSPLNRKKLRMALELGSPVVGTGYKRIRWEGKEKKQRLEIRFDDVAGCIRTPNGGSSRQTMLIIEHGEVRTRLLTVREAARLMGVRDSYKIPGSYNDGYRAMGDAVAVPVTRWLAKHLLSRLLQLREAHEGKNRPWRIEPILVSSASSAS